MSGRDYTGLYFDDLLDAFNEALRDELPEYKETDPKDPLVALGRLEAFDGHRRSAQLDHHASELAVSRFLLRSSGVELAQRAGHRVSADSPAVADILCDIQGVPGVGAELLPALATFTAEGDDVVERVLFESQEGAVANIALTLLNIADDGGTQAAATTSAHTPWAAGPEVGDAVYVGHALLQFDSVAIAQGTPGSDYTTRWEYYDGGFRTAPPSSVVDNGDGTVTLAVTPLIGSAQCGGLSVRVKCVATGSEEVRTVVYTGGVNTITTATQLGQTAVSTAVGDYELSTDWIPLTAIEQAPASSYTASWTLPAEVTSTTALAGQTHTSFNHRWQRTTINGTEGYWVRERVVAVGGSESAPANYLASIGADPTWTLRVVSARQGETVSDLLGTSTGAAFESFELQRSPFIEGSVSGITVGSDPDWSTVESLYYSDGNDKHARVIEDPDGSLALEFGDGTNGAIPPSGRSVAATYRVGARVNGNVGAGAITAGGGSSTWLTNIRNPHPASGWRARDGDDEPGIERLRRVITGAVRAGGSVPKRVVTADDAEWAAVNAFATADGRKPFARVIAVPQGAGYKTLSLVCVGSGGTAPTAADLAELEVWLNGETVGLQRFGGLSPANQRYVPVAYTPLAMAFTLTIEVASRWAHLASARAAAALRAAASPLATYDNGDYRWTVGQRLTDAAWKGVLGEAGITGLVDVTYTAPSFPITLAAMELPSFSSATITVTAV